MIQQENTTVLRLSDAESPNVSLLAVPQSLSATDSLFVSRSIAVLMTGVVLKNRCHQLLSILLRYDNATGSTATGVPPS